MLCGTVSASWLGVCTEGCQLSPCRIVYIIVNLDSLSLAVYLWCSGDCRFSLWVIAVGLLWCRQSLCRVIYVMYISAPLSSGLLMFCLVVGSQMIEVYSNVGLTKV